MRLLFILHLSSFLLSASAQEEAPSPTRFKTGVKLLFIPPPMEGTFSLGIYEAHGKLVRTLHHDATTAEFGVALNGLITYWDGRDDHGTPLAAGTYRARGYCVAPLKIEGEAYFGNDWITDDKSPRLRRILSAQLVRYGPFGVPAKAGFFVLAETIDHRLVDLQLDEKGAVIAQREFPEATEFKTADPALDGLSIKDGQIFAENDRLLDLPGLVFAVAACRQGQKLMGATSSKFDGIWVVDRTESGIKVKEFAESGEFRRELQISPTEPSPVRIASSPFSETIFLLEEDAHHQRVRALTLTAKPPEPASPSPGEPISLWKTLFSKVITYSDTFAAVQDQLKIPDGKPFVPQEKIKLVLAPNPLEQKKPGAAEVSVGFDAKGSFLKLADGLPLVRLTDTAFLKWAALARGAEPEALALCQSDGAVVEEFTVSKLGKMMAFDCGEFDYAPAHASPSP